ncbi:uncharacterized protein LOC111622886 [Centruroides sculpturatus]|uniref:uncharacterized protein LOC111622886 n=1 Tax=Centruroides sculpturatus TaxID=218467 RepID=UPI000C6D4EE2|nr:uncharacterized protein LOC111622886 [Centruroides sculpturatus]
MEEGRTELTSLDNAKELYYFSNSYKIYSLRNFCNEYILSVINNQNIFDIYEFAYNVTDNSIRYKCLKWFDEECMEVFKKSNCSNCNERTISTLVSRPIYKWMNEADVFHTVYYWAETKVNKSTNLRTIMEPYLPKIRFLAIRPECFHRYVLPFLKNVLTDEEIQLIRESLSSTCTSNLPAFICRSREERKITYYENLFYYMNRSSMKTDKDILVTSKTRFICEIFPKHNCFLTDILLPIRHSREENISGFLKLIVKNTQKSFPETFFCDGEGQAKCSSPIYLTKYTSYHFKARIDKYIFSQTDIRVKKDSYYYSPEHYKRKNDKNINKKNNQTFYFEAILYF